MMKRQGFTLLELLMVIGVMGLLGTVATAGYYAAVSNMEVRGAKESVASLILAAQQRAATDHMPTGVYFYNQLLRTGTDDSVPVVVGVAVAVRAGGRLSCVVNNKYLFDEFNDLNFGRKSIRDSDDGAQKSAVEDSSASMLLYRIDMAREKIEISSVKDYVVARDTNSGAIEERLAARGVVSTNATSYGFVISDGNVPAAYKTANSNWRAGSLYGYEIAAIQLPHNMIFGDSDGDIPNSIDNPVKADPVKPIFFKTDGRRKGSATVKMASCRTKANAGSLALSVQDKFQSDNVDDKDR